MHLAYLLSASSMPQHSRLLGPVVLPILAIPAIGARPVVIIFDAATISPAANVMLSSANYLLLTANVLLLSVNVFAPLALARSLARSPSPSLF